MLLLAMAAGSTMLCAQERDRERGPGGFRREGGFMRMHPALSAIDADHDGSISSAELAKASAALAKLDKDGDGKLTPEEMRMAFGPGGPGGPRGRGGPGGPGGPGGQGGPSPDDMVKRLMEFDKDGNGAISKDEMPERMQGMLARGDSNCSGSRLQSLP